MHGFIQRFPGFKLFAQRVNRKRIHAVGIKEFFKVQREHADLANTPNGNGSGLRKCYAKQRAAGDIGKPIVIPQEFQHRQQMRISLNLINENQGIFCFAHQFAFDRADTKVEIINRFCVLKQPVTDGIFQHVDLNEIGKQLLSNMADNICFSDLTRTVNQ